MSVRDVSEMIAEWVNLIHAARESEKVYEEKIRNGRELIIDNLREHVLTLIPEDGISNQELLRQVREWWGENPWHDVISRVPYKLAKEGEVVAVLETILNKAGNPQEQRIWYRKGESDG